MIPSSELIINPDGSVIHLHMKPEQLADKIILVGDPSRVKLIETKMDKIIFSGGNREFQWITADYHGELITVVSSGIGTDNIDIVLTELDALANVDFSTREIKATHRTLTIVRIGTCGAMQADTYLGSFIVTEISVGLDGLLNFYGNTEVVFDQEMERTFIDHVKWNPRKANPYCVYSNSDLNKQLFDNPPSNTKIVRGITLAAPGFYGPQGRIVRLSLDDNEINSKLRTFRYKGLRIENYEMESSAVIGLASLLGHRATTVCCAIAGRAEGSVNTEYKDGVSQLIDLILSRF